MKGKLEYSVSDIGKKDSGGKYDVAIAAVYPKFANTNKTKEIKEWINNTLTHRTQTEKNKFVQQLRVLEWESDSGTSIKEKLKAFTDGTLNKRFLEESLENEFMPPQPAASPPPRSLR